MTSSDKLLVSLEDGVKRITINRPERRNSVDVETVELLHEAIQRSAEDDSKVVILTGAGDTFCAGADLQATSERDIKSVDVTASLREHTNPTILAMRSLSKPIIARVHGHAQAKASRKAPSGRRNRPIPTWHYGFRAWKRSSR